MTVHQFGTFDAKNKLSHLLDLVEQGDEVIITRNGKPVARLLKEGDAATGKAENRALKAAERLRRRREVMPKDSLEGHSIKEMIEEGRM